MASKMNNQPKQYDLKIGYGVVRKWNGGQKTVKVVSLSKSGKVATLSDGAKIYTPISDRCAADVYRHQNDFERCVYFFDYDNFKIEENLKANLIEEITELLQKESVEVLEFFLGNLKDLH